MDASEGKDPPRSVFWQKVARVIEEVSSLPPQQRDDYLGQIENDTLREEIHALLSSESYADRLLRSSAAELAGPLLDDLLSNANQPNDQQEEDRKANSRLEGESVGPYRIIHEIGRGGMGRVFLAQREDVEALVALKTIDAAASTPGDLHHFRREQRILARLSHRSIARFLDARLLDDGTPCVVMEYVEGRPIDHYCREENLSLHERLRLFLSVCEAVGAAHRNLVVHQDIKPSNVLVQDAEGGLPQVKLVDFGVAQLLDDELPETDATDKVSTNDSAQQSDEAEYAPHPSSESRGTPLPPPSGSPGLRKRAKTRRRLTWSYASPEQVQGQEVSTAIDVYALGALLYALVTGRPPLEVSGRPASEATQIILEHEPPPPSLLAGSSSRTSENRLGAPPLLRDRLAKEDLDAITLKALRKDPKERYATARELANDVRRHLKNRPVQAHPALLGYQVTKFLRRNSRAVLVSCFLVALLVAATAVSFYHAQRASEEATRAEAVREFMVGLFKDADPIEGEAGGLTMEEMLDRGATRLERQFHDAPSVSAELHHVLGTAYLSLGQRERSEQHLGRAFELERALHGPSHEHVARSLDGMARLRTKQGRLEEADSLHRAALRMRRRHLGPVSREAALSLGGLGLVARKQGDYVRAEELLREGIEVHQTLVTSGRLDTSQAVRGAPREVLSEIAMLKGILGGTLYLQGRYDEAEPYMRDALALHRRAVGEMHSRVATSMNNLAVLLEKQGNAREAEPFYRAALEVKREVLGDDHLRYAASLNNLAVFMYRQSRYREADSLLLRSLAIKTESHGGSHPEVAYSLHNLGGVAEARGAYEEAERRYRRALSIRREALGETHPYTLLTLGNLGNTLAQKGEPKAAEEILRKTLRLQREKLGSAHPQVAGALHNLAKFLAGQSRCEDALPLHREAVRVQSEATSEDHWRTALFRSDLGACLTSLGRYEEAEPVLLVAYETLSDQDAQSAHVVSARQHLQELYQAWGRPEKAKAYASGE